MTTRADQHTGLAGPGPGRADQAGTGAGSRARPVDRFGGLLLILIFTYVLSAFTEGGLVSAIQVVLFLAVLLLALRNGRLQRRTVQIVAVGLVLGTAVASSLQLTESGTAVAGAADLWTALILLLSITLIVRRVLSRPEITLQSIYGAVSAYLVLGLMYATVFAAMSRFGGNTFFANGQHGDTQTFQYFSFITLTTTGYGDFTAAGNGGRAVAVLEAITGQIFLATLVARLVAGFRGSARRAASQAQTSQAAASQAPAGARRARARRAGASGLIGLRPPGAARRRPGPVSGGRAARTDRR